MARLWRWPVALCGAALAVAADVQAQQFNQDDLDLQARANLVQGAGARALGMAGAFLARADDGTAASWNPAGLSYLRVPEVTVAYAGAQIRGTERFLVKDASGNDVGARRRDFSTGSDPDFLAATWPFTVGAVNGSAQISYQRVISFTFDREITEFFPMRFIDSDGGFDVIALGTGWQLRPSLRLGATVNRWFGGYHHQVERITAPGTPEQPITRGTIFQEADIRMEGWNVNLGLIWTPRPSVSLGAVFKTPFSAELRIQKFRSDAVPPGINAATTTFLGLDNRIEFPAAYGAGISWRPRSALTLSADYTLTSWSKGRITEYFRLQAVLPNRPATVEVADELPYPTFDGRFPQHDTHQVRVGVEYVLIGRRLKVPLRAGVLGDRQYIETFNGGAPWFVGASVGTGLILGPVLFDIAYLFEHGRYTDTDSQANHIRSHRFVSSLIYRHGNR